MCAAPKGQIPWNKGKKGYHLTEESLKKRKEKIGDWSGENNPNYGKRWSDEQRRIASESHIGISPSEETKKKISITLTGIKRGPQSDEHKQKNRESHLGKPSPNKGKTGEKSGVWKGGYGEVPLYDTHIYHIQPIEECRRNKEDPNILEVKCTYCGKWFVPTLETVYARRVGINCNDRNRFYCSKECKSNCPIYNQRKYPKGFKEATSREVQPELRQMRFALDNYTCQKCEQHGGSLHCHHYEGIWINPIESADLDMCVTLCVDCHMEAHEEIGCRRIDLRNKCH
jgi:hypothetical protein